MSKKKDFHSFKIRSQNAPLNTLKILQFAFEFILMFQKWPDLQHFELLGRFRSVDQKNKFVEDV